MSFFHKFKSSNPYIFSTWWRANLWYFKLSRFITQLFTLYPGWSKLFTWQVSVKKGKVSVRKTISDFLPCTCNTDTPVHNSTAKIKFYYLENNIFLRVFIIMNIFIKIIKSIFKKLLLVKTRNKVLNFEIEKSLIFYNDFYLH